MSKARHLARLLNQQSEFDASSFTKDESITSDKLAPEAAFPPQLGEDGKVLLSNGSVASWEIFDADPAGTSIAMSIALG